MNTSTGKAIAEDRHAYMEEFVKRFLGEWDGKIQIQAIEDLNSFHDFKIESA